MRHFLLAARAGHETSLEAVKIGFKEWIATKDEYANVLRAYHERQKEMKSDERDEAAEVYNVRRDTNIRRHVRAKEEYERNNQDPSWTCTISKGIKR